MAWLFGIATGVRALPQMSILMRGKMPLKKQNFLLTTKSIIGNSGRHLMHKSDAYEISYLNSGRRLHQQGGETGLHSL